MKDIRQSLQFARFMEDLGWKVEKTDHGFIYLRKFPFLGYFAKIPRPHSLLTQEELDKLRMKYNIFKLNISPFLDTNRLQYQTYKRTLLNYGFKVNQLPFNPTTTIQIDFKKNNEAIFNDFTEAKRRGVRKAINNGIIIKECANLDSFIEIRKKQYFPAGFLIVKEMKALWKNFSPRNASLLLAYQQSSVQMQTITSIDINKSVAGILLLYYDKIAYYWYASALKRGKRLFAPTLLVWEALKLARKKGCEIFDFEGIYDDRFPEASKSWKGFTKFKEGFGGRKVVYMENFTI